MKTVTIQIGNTDDKLPQPDWAAYVMSIKHAILGCCKEVHFFGAPPNYERWQNVAWVVNVEEEALESLQRSLTDVRECFEQDSVAFTVGETVFV